MEKTGQIGDIAKSGDGKSGIQRFDAWNAAMISQLNPRFQELALRGKLFSGGMPLTSISNAIWTGATTDATSKGIVGLWNPLTSGKNAIIIQAHVNTIITAATNTGPGGFNWQTATQQNAITTGNTPFNRGTLTAAGSVMKDMSGVALTGLSGASVVRQGSSIGCGSSANFSFVGTAVGQATPNVPGVENFDGSLIVPPGGILILTAATTPVAHSAVSGLLWAELPV